MPKKRDEAIYPPFPWKVLNGSVQECHVVIREQPGEPTVHLLAKDVNGKSTKVAYFHPDELNQIIEALQAAQVHLSKR